MEPANSSTTDAKGIPVPGATPSVHGRQPPSSSAAPSRTPEETPPDRSAVRVWLWILGLLVILSPLEYQGARKVWHVVRRQQARKEVGRVMGLLVEQRYLEADRAVRRAIQLDDEDPEVLRVTARWCTLTRRASGLNYWARLFARTTPTLQDQLEHLDLVLALRRLDLSKSLLRDLLAQHPHDRGLAERVLRHHELMGDAEQLLAAARIAVSEFPADDSFQLKLGSLLLLRPSRPEQAEGRRLLWNVALGSRASREEAVNLLAASRAMDRADRELLAVTLARREHPTLHDQLQEVALRLSLGATGRQREDLWHRAEGFAVAYPDATNRLVLAWWLANQGETNRAVAVLPAAAANTNGFAAFGTLEVLLRCRQWDTVHRMLDEETLALHPAQRYSAWASWFAGISQPSEAAVRFEKARVAAADAPGMLLQIATQAERSGQPQAAMEALTRVGELNPTLTYECGLRALALVGAVDDLKFSQRAVRRLAEFLPDDPGLTLEAAWLDLLCLERVAEAHASLTRLKELKAREEDVRFGLALAELRQGQASAALNRLEAQGVEPKKLSFRLQAVYVAVLFANGQREAAARLAEALPSGSLRLQERELFSKFL